jgi:Xaa-Pro aminopeptidase
MENHGNINEYETSQYITKTRSKREAYICDSFEPIVGFNANGAIIHYKPNANNSAHIIGNGILLIDSGGHYLGGTTDVTRVLALGEVTEEQKSRYTEILKGLLNLSGAQFPKGTSGSNIDSFARKYLWESGHDYPHSTGHGVGNMLNVHEGPFGISKSPNEFPLEANIILSNEPGYYKIGEFGMRIENLMFTKEISDEFLAFETLTLVPYCKKLIKFEMIDKAELEELKNYYEHIRKIIIPRISLKAQQWCLSELDI